MDNLLKGYVTKTNVEGSAVTTGFDFTPYIRSYQVEYTDIEAFNERTASGKCVRDISRTIKTIKCSFKTMSKEEAVKILDVLNNTELKVAYFDTVNGTYSEDSLLKVYPSVTRNTSVYGVNPTTIYNEISVEFIEI